MRRVDFEAHFLSPALKEALRRRETAPYLTQEDVMIFGPDCALPYAGIWPALGELGDRRVAEMDAAGVEIQILSCVGGVELLPQQEGAIAARETNDWLYQAIQSCPERFRGYACLAPQDVQAATDELDRCVTKLGFVGWNAFSNFGEDGLDDPRYFPLLQKAEELGVFVYLHPTMPKIERLHGYGRQLVASGLGFGIDVMITLTRMILAGVFDRLPKLKVVLGHLGEGLPFVMDRMRARGTRESRLPAVNERAARDYFSTNIWVSTSGNFSSAAFRCALEALGPDHILLGSDDPMERLGEAIDFLEGLGLEKETCNKICWKNAARYFGIR